MTSMTPSDDPRLVRRAQVLDLARSVPLGVLMPLEASLLVTIALKHFDAPGLVKGIVAAANGVGLLATPLVTSLARRWGRPVMIPVACLSAIGVIGFVLGSLDSLALFAVGSVVGIATINAMYPLVTVTYERNFPAAELGRRVGWGMSLKVLVSAVIGLSMGAYMNGHPGRWWIIPAAGGLACAVLVVLHLQTPSAQIGRAHV